MSNQDLDPRQLNTVIARLLGLDVLGKAPCWCDPETGHWEVSYDGEGKMQTVYLRSCLCDCGEPGDMRYFGHIAGCLEVVPFYHQDDGLAIKALEQICDERTLAVIPIRTFGGAWVVELYTTQSDRIARGRDKSLALAICKTLAGLENVK